MESEKIYDSRLEDDEMEDDFVISEDEGDLEISEGEGDLKININDTGVNGVVVLIVSDEDGIAHKSSIVDALTRADPASWKEETTLSGTRILTGTELTVVDTTPLECIPGKSPTEIARQWISHNLLRQIIFKKQVIVVCVITRVVLGAPCHSAFLGYDLVGVLSILFKPHRDGVLFSNINAIGDVMKRRMERYVRYHGFLTEHIIYSSSSSVSSDVARVVERMDGASRRSWVQNFLPQLSNMRKPTAGTTAPLVMKPLYLADASFEQKKYTLWGPQRVILFGRMGSGKSTLAQMLTSGNLEPEATTFSYGSGMRRHTKAIQCGQGRGWLVVDTPGLGGESNDEESTISTEEAQDKIKRFVARFVEKDGVFAHNIFVLKKDRIDQLEINVWNFFKHLFGEDLKHFVIVISNADKKWIDREMDYLKRCFDGCESFLGAEFPSTWRHTILGVQGSEELRAEEESIQRLSLGQLEYELALLERCDRPCDYGQLSRMNKVMERERSNSDMRVERSLRTKTIVQGSAVMFQLDELSWRVMHFFSWRVMLSKDGLYMPPLSLV